MSLYPISRHSLLHKTFVHLDGIGPRKERHLWRNGIVGWEQLRDEAPRLFPGKRLDGLLKSLDASLAAWARGDLSYFYRQLPGDEVWRLMPGVEGELAFFDIEADGNGMPPQSHSTVVGFFFRGELRQAVEYRERRELVEEMMDVSPIFCSFNGAIFDIPFLAKEFLLPLAGKAHIDLFPWLKRLGYSGGLKAIQKSLPELTQRKLPDLSGWDAVKLWRAHEAGEDGALQTLLEYNAEDVLILPELLRLAFQEEPGGKILDLLQIKVPKEFY